MDTSGIRLRVIFWLGVILQAYAVKKEWERQVSDDRIPVAFQIVIRQIEFLIKQKRKGMPNAQMHYQATENKMVCGCASC